MKKNEIRKDIPEKFYMDSKGTGFPVIVNTTGELKKALNDLPDDILIRQGFESGVHLIVYNVGYDNLHLSFQENEYDDEEACP